MRFYDIQILDDVLGPRMRSDGTPYRWTSYVDGRTLPGAQQIEFDIPITYAAAQTGGCTIRIWGVSLLDISQSANLNGALIKVYGGMQAGLPLANPAQRGLLVSGAVWQAFGNWIGVEQTLDLVIIPAATTSAEASDPSQTVPTQTVNLPFSWKANTPIADAIRSTLTTGFPGYTVTINSLNAKLVTAADEVDHKDGLAAFAQYLKEMTASIVGGDYAGVDIAVSDKTITVFDTPLNGDAKMIEFNDLIGQPTWIGLAEMQFACVMRGDIKVGSKVKMPPQALQTTTAQSYPAYRDKAAFQGEFQVTSIHHVGNFRHPDAQAWVSVFNCFTLGAAAAAPA